MDANGIAKMIWKMYDIRSTYPEPLSAEVAFRIGWAFAIYLRQAFRLSRGSLAIGRDMRNGSEELALALAQGVRAAGIRPVDLGLISADLVYYVMGQDRGLCNGGLMVTASHNPANENGVKFVLPGARPFWAKTGLNVVRSIFTSPSEPIPEPGPPCAAEQRHYAAAYVAKLFRIAAGPVAPFRIVVDAGNGMACVIFPRLSERLPCRVVPLFFELDGSFPNRPSDPSQEESLAQLKAAVIREHAVLGIAFDGDADRVAFVDETGCLVPAPVVGALLTAWFRRQYADVRVVLDLAAHRAAEEAIQAAGATRILCPPGHPRIKDMMRAADALLAFEISHHFYFRQFFSCDSGMLAVLFVLQMLTAAGQPLSVLAGPLRDRYPRQDHNVPMPNEPAVHEAIARVEAAFPDPLCARVTRFDLDVRKDYADWWFSLRPSETELTPRLRLSVEATAQESVEQHATEIRALIDGARSEDGRDAA